MSETTETETINKEELNPLFKARFKPRSVDSTKQTHLPRLQHKNANFKYVLLGDSMLERYLTVGAGKVDPNNRRRRNNDDEEVDGNEEPVDMWEKYHNMKVINLGVGGDGVSEVMHRVFNMNSIYSWPDKPEKIVIWVGTNDIERYNEEIVFDGIVNLVNKIQECYKKGLKHSPEVGIISILPRFTRSPKISVSDLNRSIQRLNYKLGKFAESQTDVDFLDIYFDFYEKYKILNEYFDGPVHINNLGYQKIDQKFNDFLTTRKNPPVTKTNKKDKKNTSKSEAVDDVNSEDEAKPITAAMKKNMKRRNRKKESKNTVEDNDTEKVDDTEKVVDEPDDESNVVLIEDEPDNVVEVNYKDDDDDNGRNTVTKPVKKYSKKTIETLNDIDVGFE